MRLKLIIYVERCDNKAMFGEVIGEKKLGVILEKEFWFEL